MVKFPASSTGWHKADADQTEDTFFEAQIYAVGYDVRDDYFNTGQKTIGITAYRTVVRRIQTFPDRRLRNMFRKRRTLLRVDAYTINWPDSGAIDPSRSLSREAKRQGLNINSFILYRATRGAADKLRAMRDDAIQFNRSNFRLT